MIFTRTHRIDDGAWKATISQEKHKECKEQRADYRGLENTKELQREEKRREGHNVKEKKMRSHSQMLRKIGHSDVEQ